MPQTFGINERKEANITASHGSSDHVTPALNSENTMGSCGYGVNHKRDVKMACGMRLLDFHQPEGQYVTFFLEPCGV